MRFASTGPKGVVPLPDRRWHHRTVQEFQGSFQDGFSSGRLTGRHHSMLEGVMTRYRSPMLLFLATLLAVPALANFCAQDAVPAATLLFPYVEVGMTPAGVPDYAGQTTISRITNVSRDSIVVHFTVWDLAGVPRLSFDEVLSGFDSLQINWRDAINGRFDLFDTSRTDFAAISPMTTDPFEWGPDGRGQRGGLTTPQNRSAITATQCGGGGPPPRRRRGPPPRPPGGGGPRRTATGPTCCR